MKILVGHCYHKLASIPPLGQRANILGAAGAHICELWKKTVTTFSYYSLYFRWLHCNVCYGAAASTFMEAEAATNLTFSHI